MFVDNRPGIMFKKYSLLFGVASATFCGRTEILGSRLGLAPIIGTEVYRERTKTRTNRICGHFST